MKIDESRELLDVLRQIDSLKASLPTREQLIELRSIAGELRNILREVSGFEFGDLARNVAEIAGSAAEANKHFEQLPSDGDLDDLSRQVDDICGTLRESVE